MLFLNESGCTFDAAQRVVNKINDIEKGLEATLKGDNKIKAFVLSVPQKDATNAEIKYWVTSGSLANGLHIPGLCCLETSVCSRIVYGPDISGV